MSNDSPRVNLSYRIKNIKANRIALLTVLVGDVSVDGERLRDRLSVDEENWHLTEGRLCKEIEDQQPFSFVNYLISKV